MLGYCSRPTLLGVTYLADAELVTMGVTNVADAGAVPLADTDMTFPAAAGEIGLVTTGVTNGADATPMNDRNSHGSHNGPVLTDMWCGGETSIGLIC